MKKIIFALVVLMLAAPAWADVVITCSNSVVDGNNVITISYDADSEANLVRAIAIDVNCVGGAGVISDVNCLSADFGFHIYLGAIDIDSEGTVQDWGTCQCDGGVYEGTLDDVNAMTIESASLYEVGVDPDPCKSGDLVSFMICGDGDITITLKENEIRGGVVMENANEVVNVITTSTCFVSCDCLDSSDVGYALWKTMGKPGDWCCDYQTLGDITGDGAINIFDLFPFRAAYGTSYPNTGYDCRADLTHDGGVNIFDLFPFRANYGTTPGAAYSCPGTGECGPLP